MPTNEFGQPIGADVPWTPARSPEPVVLEGEWCRVEALDPALHAEDLHGANSADDGSMWTYLPYGPFASAGAYEAWCRDVAGHDDPRFFAITDRATGRATGVAAYLRIDPPNGVIEIGHIALAPGLQRTTAASESMYLLMRHAFDDLGYRRYEWKCDALNAPSLRAAQRFGFTFEGVFRQAIMYKGRNRDTAWYSIVDSEWPAIKTEFERWLDPANFDRAGRQRSALRMARGS